MGYSGRKKSTVVRTRVSVEASKKVGVEASPSNNRADRQKARDEAKRQEETERSESVNGYGRGFGSFLTGGVQPDKAAPVTTEGGKKVDPGNSAVFLENRNPKRLIFRYDSIHP
jgi:hypothetical protein